MVHYKVLQSIYERVVAENPGITEPQAVAWAWARYDAAEYQMFYGIPMPEGAKPVRIEIQEMCQKAFDDRKAAKEERRRIWNEKNKL